MSIERFASSDSCSHWYREIHTFREQTLDVLHNNHTLKYRITDADYEQIWRKGSHDFAWHFYDDLKESEQVERSLRTSQIWGWDEICGFDSRVNPARLPDSEDLALSLPVALHERLFSINRPPMHLGSRYDEVSSLNNPSS